MGLKYNSDKFESCLNTFRGLYSNPAVDEYQGSVMIPLDFSLEMDGISGIIPHSAFEIPVNTLPKSYRTKKGESKVAFILHTIDHNFNNNKWTTKITGQTLNIRFDELTEAEKEAIKKAQTPAEVSVKTLIENIQNEAKKVLSKGSPSKGNTLAKDREAAYNALEAKYPGFKDKVKQLAADIGSNETDLVRVMYAESRFDPSIINGIGCVGLIQFCPDKTGLTYKTINGKKYYLSDIRRMDPLKQLDVVKEFYKAVGFNRNKKVDVYDLYGATFLPIMVGKPSNWLAQSRKLSAQEITHDNPGIAKFSTRSDGLIDKAAFIRYVDSIL